MSRRRNERRPMTAAEERQIVDALRRGAHWKALAKRLHRCGTTIAAIAAKHGIPSKVRFWSAEEEAYLRANYADGRTEDIARQLRRSVREVYQKAHALGLEKSQAYLQELVWAKKGQRVSPGTEFPKGHVPANKGLRRPGWFKGRMRETQFKKGQRSGVAVKLWKPVGTERFSKEGYLERKVNNDLPPQRRWRAVHLIMWEEVHGPLPEGFAVAFKNGDKRDLRLENFELISRAELMRRNTIHSLPPELRGAINAVAGLKRAIRRKVKRNGRESAQRTA